MKILVWFQFPQPERYIRAITVEKFPNILRHTRYTMSLQIAFTDETIDRVYVGARGISSLMGTVMFNRKYRTRDSDMMYITKTVSDFVNCVPNPQRPKYSVVDEINGYDSF